MMNNKKIFNVILKNGQIITVEADEFSYGSGHVKFEDKEKKRWVAIFNNTNIAGFIQIYP